jgi:ribosomal protein L7Ae-like RNA K-turn-binding protein
MRKDLPPDRRKSSPAPTPDARASDLRKRVQSLLGFAVKAGRVTAGYSLTQRGLASGEVAFVLAAWDLAPRRLQSLLRTAAQRNVRCVVGWSSVELGSLLDRGSTGAVGITDSTLARGMDACAAAAESVAATEQAHA